MMPGIPDRDGARRGSPPARSLWSDLLAPPEFFRERTESAPTRFEAIFEAAMLILAIALFSNGAIQFGVAVAPGWSVELLLPLCALAALVGHLYSRRLARGLILWREWLVLLVPFVLLTRFTPYLGGGSLAADAAAWATEPLGFLEAGFLFRALLIFGAWVTAFVSTQNLNDLRVQRGELSELPARLIYERGWESDRLRAIDHTEPLRRLAGRFMMGGIGLILMASLTAANVQQVLTLEGLGELISLGRPSSATALLNVVAYFVVMLLLLAEAQFVRNRTLWTLDGVDIAPDMARRWAAAAGVLVAAGLVAALILPTEGLLGLSQVVDAAVALLFYVASYALAAIFLLFWLVTYPLRWLMGDSAVGGETPSRFVPPPMQPSVEGEGSLFELLRSLVFWTVMGGVLVYTVVAMSRHGRLADRLPALARLLAGVRGTLALLLLFVVRFLSGAGRVAATLARSLISSNNGQAAGGRGGFRLADLLPGRDPRRIVIAIYGMVAARAGELGLERRVGQTASEYRERLREGIPEASADVDALTDAFLMARYSQHPVERPHAALARRCWNHIRGQLRRARAAR